MLRDPGLPVTATQHRSIGARRARGKKAGCKMSLAAEHVTAAFRKMSQHSKGAYANR
jgi:hypothetical protein